MASTASNKDRARGERQPGLHLGAEESISQKAKLGRLAARTTMVCMRFRPKCPPMALRAALYRLCSTTWGPTPTGVLRAVGYPYIGFAAPPPCKPLSRAHWGGLYDIVAGRGMVRRYSFLCRPPNARLLLRFCACENGPTYGD
jgi:hypothetical protein